MLLIGDISKKLGSEQASIITSDDEMLYLYKSFYGESPSPTVRIICRPKKLANFLIFVAIILNGMMWILSHLTFRRKSAESIYFGSDFAEAQSHIVMINTIIGDPEKCLCVYRSRHQKNISKVDLGNLRFCLSSEGGIPIFQLSLYIRTLISDCCLIYRYLSHLQANHFFLVSKYHLHLWTCKFHRSCHR